MKSGLPPDDSAVARTTSRIWMMVLAGGLLAGLAGFGTGEYALRLFAPSLDLPPGIRGDASLAPAEHARRVREWQDRSATMAYGALGALLGVALGAVGGMARRSPRAAITAALVGLVLGVAAGGGITFLVLPWYHQFHAIPGPDNAMQELYLALATHGGIWVAVGVAAGLALGLSLGGGRVPQTIIGGILGAALGASIYEFGGAVGFPLDKTMQPMASATGPRLLAHLAVSLCVSAGTLWAADHLRLRRESKTARA
jgi:hypothetical protein